jgi:autotransporter strand-loop-strand O-heptosyltransferase
MNSLAQEQVAASTEQEEASVDVFSEVPETTSTVPVANVPKIFPGVGVSSAAGREAAPATGALSGSAKNSPYLPLAAKPTQAGPAGIRFDFNDGCRLHLPIREKGRWRVQLRDLDTGNVIYQTESKGAVVNSSKRWYVRFRIEVWEIEDESSDKLPRPVLTHDYDLNGREALIQFPIGTLGDTLAWFAYAERFAQKHPNCKVTVALSALIIPLLRKAYPALRLMSHVEAVDDGVPGRAYATYSMGLFFDDVACNRQPVDFRHVGLHRTAGHILGVDPTEIAPRLALHDESRPIKDPYVCIAVQATSAAKTWTNPNGWREVIQFIKEHGYRVVCIDQKPVHGAGLMWTHIPNGAEDKTGISLEEAARYLRHADFFVGLSSGLSWLAWAAGTIVVLISGYSFPSTEFSTPFRIINWHTCNGCWNDPKFVFDHRDFLWCPRHANTRRQFECTRLITPAHVIGTLATIPGFGQPKMSRAIVLQEGNRT